MALTSEQLKRLIEAVATTIIAETDRLTALDQAIGDGDHGLNMKRGFEAVLADLDGLARKPLPDAVNGIAEKSAVTSRRIKRGWPTTTVAMSASSRATRSRASVAVRTVRSVVIS